jgi:hypothetical protein
MWQQYLEETFPGSAIEKDGSKSLNKTNTAKKFVLDQTVGAWVNTAAFIAYLAYMNGKDSAGIQKAVSTVGGLMFRRDSLLMPRCRRHFH